MNSESHPDTAPDTTLTPPSQSRPRNKRHARRKDAGVPFSAAVAQPAANQGGFEVLIGDSGEVVQSAWRFGG